jgi:hypothetical protein
MDDLTTGQEEAVAATVGAIQRIAMAIVELPTEGREAQYAMVRQNFEAALMDVGIEGATAHATGGNLVPICAAKSCVTSVSNQPPVSRNLMAYAVS